MIRDTVSHLRGRGPAGVPRRRALLRRLPREPAYALEALRVAAEAGAEVVALCDTNGGMLPDWVGRRRPPTSGTPSARGALVGIHCHNDTGCAVANSLAAVDAGATARAGHAQRLRRAHRQRRPRHGRRQPRAQAAAARCCPTRPAAGGHPHRARGRRGHQRAAVARASRTSASAPSPTRPACTPRAIKVDPDLYQHLDPSAVGNDMRLLVSDMAGRASIELKGRGLGFDLSEDRELVTRVTARVKALEAHGLHVRGRRRVLRAAARARGRRARGRRTSTWSPGASSPTRRPDGEAVSEATVKLRRRRRADRHRSARATGRSTPSTTRCGRRSARPTRRSRSSS